MIASEVSIIGAGPSGISAAIQLKRYGLKPFLFEKDKIGGLLRNAHLIENYPGFPAGVSGPRLVCLFEKQLRASDIKVHFEDVIKIERRNERFFLQTDRKQVSSKIVVIATGTVPRRLQGFYPGEELRKFIFYEIYPLRRMKNKNIAIIGSGDAAFDYGLSLSPQNKVIILGRGRQAKCLPLLWERVAERKNISFLPNAFIEKINNHGRGLELTLSCIDRKEKISADFLVVAIGRKPCLNFMGAGLKKKSKKLIKKKVLYMIGDVKNGLYRQTAICVGDGVRAAMEIFQKIKR